MNRTIEGKIRRIAYNPFNASSLNSSSTVVFYMEGDGTTYTVGSIKKGLGEAVLLSKPGDEIFAQLEKSEHRFAVGAVIAAWTNKTFEAEQAALANAQAEPNSPSVSQPELSSQQDTRAELIRAMYSDIFHGVRYYFTDESDLERAREVNARSGLDLDQFENGLDGLRIKWSTDPAPNA